MRTDTNKVALRALRALLGGATPFDVEAGTTKVSCSMAAIPPAPWPVDLPGVTEAEDGPWPAGVAVDCQWTGGACRLLVEVYRWTSTDYLHDVSKRRTPGAEDVADTINAAMRELLAGLQIPFWARTPPSCARWRRPVEISSPLQTWCSAGWSSSR